MHDTSAIESRAGQTVMRMPPATRSAATRSAATRSAATRSAATRSAATRSAATRSGLARYVATSSHGCLAARMQDDAQVNQKAWE